MLGKSLTGYCNKGLCNKSHRQIKSLAHGDNPPKRPRVYEEHMNELCAALRVDKL